MHPRPVHSESLSHEYIATLDAEYERFVLDVETRLDVVRKIATLYGDDDLSKITVTSIAPGSVRFSWTNNTLPVSPCPRKQVLQLLFRIVVNGTISPEFVEAMKPYRVIGAGVDPKGACVPGASPTTLEPMNRKPEVMNPIEKQDVTVGEIFELRVPRNTFYDQEDGNTRRMTIVMLTSDHLTLPIDSWIEFDKSMQIMRGLPLSEQAGLYHYFMFAVDSHANIGEFYFEIEVHPRPVHSESLSHEFIVTLDTNYEKFVLDVETRLDVVRKIATLYGDDDLSKITVTSIAPGSVRFSWTNNTLPVSPCPIKQVFQLLSRIVVNGTINPEFVEAMKPYRVIGAGCGSKGACVESKTPEMDEPEEINQMKGSI